jgi:hypothetical protein
MWYLKKVMKPPYHKQMVLLKFLLNGTRLGLILKKKNQKSLNTKVPKPTKSTLLRLKTQSKQFRFKLTYLFQPILQTAAKKMRKI